MNRIVAHVDAALAAGVRPDEIIHALVTAVERRQDRVRVRHLVEELRGYQARRLRSWLDNHPQPEWRPCIRCDELFAAWRSDARYCSTRCRVAAKRLRDTAPAPVVTA